MGLVAADLSQLSHLVTSIVNYLNNKTETPCSKQLLEMLSDSEKQSRALNNLFKYTSKNLGEMGNYRDCANAGSRHILLRLLVTPIIPCTTAIGICGPINCTEGDYNSALSTPIRELLPTILGALDVPLKGRYWVSDDSVAFYDTKHHSNELAEINTLTIVSFGCVILFLVIGILASIMDSMKSTGKFDSKPETIQDKLICSFSLVRNMKGLIYADNIISPAVNAAYGVLSILLIWIIAAHVCLYQSVTPTVNILDQNDEIQNNPMLQPLIMAEGAMGAIFAIWTFLSTLILLQLSKEDFTIGACIKLAIRNFFKYILVDVAIILYIIGISPLEHTESPLAVLNKRNIEACKEYWWHNILYINNFFPNYNSCVEWMSYVSLKYQLYIFAIIVTFIYIKNKAAGIICAVIFFFGSIAVQIIVIIQYDLSFTYLYNKLSQNDVYFVLPYSRLTSVILGLLCAWGYFFYSKDEGDNEDSCFNRAVRYFLNRIWIRLITYIIGAALIITTIYMQYVFNHYPEYIQRYQDIIALTFVYFLFVLGVFMFMMPMIFEKLYLIKSILCSKFWAVIGRSMYSIYSLSNILILMERASEMHGLYLSNSRVVFMTMHLSVLAFIYGIGFTLVFEAPMSWIMNYFLFPDITQKIYPSEAKELPIH